MATNNDAEAMRRIREAADLGLALLDLGDLPTSAAALAMLPQAAGTLRALSLGQRKWEQDASGLFHLVDRSGRPPSRQVFENLRPLAQMTGLTHLSLDGVHVVHEDCVDHLAGLRSLEVISLRGSSSVTTLQPLAGLTGLRRLDASECRRLTQMPSVQASFPVLQALVLGGCECLGDHITIHDHPHLQHIAIEGTSVKALSLDHLPALEVLSCQSCGLLAEIQLARLEKLQSLVLNNCPRLETARLSELATLEQLNFSGLGKLRELRLQTLPGIIQLDCSGCRSLTAISGVEELANLQELNLTRCGMAEFASIKRLLEASDSPLKKLLLSGCRFFDLPPEFCGHGVGFMPGDNMTGRIRSYYRRLKSENSTEGGGASFCRVILMGNPWAGKTELVDKLVSETFIEEARSRTEGIRLVESDRDIDFSGRGLPETVFISFWDCGGQDMYHNTHRIFVKGRGSGRNVFVLVWGENMPVGRNANEGHPLEYWMGQIRALDPEASILILTNWHNTPPAQAGRNSEVVDALLQRMEESESRPYVESYACNLRDPGTHTRTKKTILGFLDKMIKLRLGSSAYRCMPAGNLAIIRQIREMRASVQAEPPKEPGSTWITGQKFMQWVARHCAASAQPQQQPEDLARQVAEDLADYGVLFFDQTKKFGADSVIALDLVGAIEALYRLFKAGAGPAGRHWLDEAYFSQASLDVALKKEALASAVELALIKNLVDGCGVAFPVFKTKRGAGAKARDHDFLAPWKIGSSGEQRPGPPPATEFGRRCYWRGETLGVHVLHSLMRLAVSSHTEWYEPKFWHALDDRWEMRFSDHAGSVTAACAWSPMSRRGYGGWLELGVYGDSRQAVKSMFEDVKHRLLHDVCGWQEDWPKENGQVVLLEEGISTRPLLLGIAYRGQDGQKYVQAIKSQWSQWGLPGQVVD
ncbi:MAG TPA: hypothetical protein VGE39_03635, partial [Prosthecobacter sp.]